MQKGKLTLVMLLAVGSLGWSRPAAAVTPTAAWNVVLSQTSTGTQYLQASCTDPNGKTYLLYSFSFFGLHLATYGPDGTYLSDVPITVPTSGQQQFSPSCMTADGSGVVYMGGATYNNGSDDLMTVAYDAATGNENWQSPPYHPPSYASARAVMIDPAGGVLFAGHFSYTYSGQDGVLIKYSSSGSQMWADVVHLNVPYPFTQATAVAADNAGGSYFLGNTNPGVGFDATIVTKVVDSSGLISWTRTYGASGVALDNPLGVIRPGTSTLYVVAGSPPTTDGDVLMVLDGSGNVSASVWFNTGLTQHAAGGMIIDAQGRVTVAGNRCCGGVADDAQLIRFTSALAVDAGFPVTIDSGGDDADNGSGPAQISLGADPSGSTYIAFSFKFGTANCFGVNRMALRKYDGPNVAWTRSYDGAVDYQVVGAARDLGGNLYVGAGTRNSSDSRVFKFGPDGAFKWQGVIADPAYCNPQIGYQGVAWNATTVFALAEGRGLSCCNNDLVVYKRDAATGAAAGKYVVNPINDLNPGPLNVDGGGNLYITGDFYSSTVSTESLFVTKLDAAGSPIWATAFINCGDNSDRPQGAALDGLGHLYVLETDRPANKYVVIKLDANTGQKIWSMSYSGGLQSILDQCTIVAHGNQVWFCGSDQIGSLASANGRVFALDGNGNVLWTQTVSGGQNAGFIGMDVNAAGQVFAAGVTYPPSTANYDVFTAALNADGSVRWTQSFDSGSSFDIAYAAVASDPGVDIVGFTGLGLRLIRYVEGAASPGLSRFDLPAVAYPNPVSGDTMNLALQLPSDAAEIRVDAFTVAGRLAYEGVFNAVTQAQGGVALTGMSRWAPGRYVLKTRAKLADGTTKDFPAVKVIVRR